MSGHRDNSPCAPIFVGLDLAWSRRNRSGGAVIAGHKLVNVTGALTDDAEILAYIADQLTPNAPLVVAIDAPLRVANKSGRRRCDHELSQAWQRFEAGAYPANRQLLAYDGDVRGEALVAALADKFGIVQTAPIPQHAMGRHVCEVFPHPAHVALFDLERTLKYKRKPGRTPAQIVGQYARYQALLRGLQEADPPLGGLDELVDSDAATLRGRALRELEDGLDAVTCAYVACYAWWHGPARQLVYGSVSEGHILVPCPPAMRDRLASGWPVAG